MDPAESPSPTTPDSGPATRPRSGKRWIVGALVIIGLGTAAAQFVPMVMAATQEAGVRSGTTATSTATGATSTSTATGATSTATAAPGETLPVGAAFTAISAGAAPPGDVLRALAVPAGSTRTGHDDYDQGNGTYDRAVNYTTSLTAGTLFSFYRTFLPRHGWTVSGEYPVPDSSAREILARHIGSDGNYWEVGIAVPAPSSTPAAGTTGTSTFQVRLQLVDDEQ